MLSKQDIEIINKVLNDSDYIKHIHKHQCEKIKRQDSKLSDSVVFDYLKNVSKFKPRGLKAEYNELKKIKLSFFNDADDKTKELYLKYFNEVEPWFFDELKKNVNKAFNKALEISNKAKRNFILNNSLLVFSKINDEDRYKNYDDDLMQEGIIGLIEALKRFDLSTNNRFSTYAMIWINKYMNQYKKDHNSILSISYHCKNYIVQIYNLETKYLNEFHRKPTDEEIMKELGISKKNLTYCKMASAKIVSNESIILENNNKNFTVGETIVDKNNDIELYNEEVIINLLYEAIENGTLTDTEKYIIYSRYGFYENKKTISKLSQELDIKEHKIRNIEAKALKKLKEILESLKPDINYELIEQVSNKQKSR